MPRVREMKAFIIDVNDRIDALVAEIGEKKAVKLLSTNPNHPITMDLRQYKQYKELLYVIRIKMIDDISRR